jgi:PAS domain S-box-containing protein
LGWWRSRLPDIAAVLFVAIVLVAHGVLELADRSVVSIVLAGAGFAAVPWLCAVALRLGSDVRTARAEEAVKARLLNCAETTGQELIWEVDPDGVVTYMSVMARSMFGVDPAELVGNSVFVLLAEEDQQVARRLLDECVRERTGWTGLVFTARHTDGSTRLVETTGVARRDSAGAVVGFTATTRRLDDDSVRRIARDKLRTRIVEVLERDCIHTFFQPIVDLRTGVARGHEALSRFAAEPAQPPDRWFADAERVDLGTELDLKAIRTALGAAQALPRGGYVSINVAPATLTAEGLVTTIARSAIAFDRIVIELTEHVSVDDYQALRTPLEILRARGVRLAIDDAGSGYASFRHILRLRPDIIKLDRDIVRDLDRDPARAALVRALVSFAHEIGATVTAEGVETAAEHLAAANLGIDAAQGYLFAVPARVEGQSLHRS